jgi:hypothetical protein
MAVHSGTYMVPESAQIVIMVEEIAIFLSTLNTKERRKADETLEVLF